MAIGRISGPMLFPNLERQGVDLAFEGNILYIDVTNRRLGANTITPNAELQVIGTANLANITIKGNTIRSNMNVVDFGYPANITIAGGAPNSVLFTDGNGVLNWAQTTSLNQNFGNIFFQNNAIKITNLNGNLELEANGTGNVTTINNFYAANVITANVNSIYLNGNLRGTNIIVSDTVNSTSFFGTNSSITPTYTQLQDILIQNNTISSVTANLHIAANVSNPNNLVIFDNVSALWIPAGNTAQRPPNPQNGYFRYNTDIETVEWWANDHWVGEFKAITHEFITADGINVNYTLKQEATNEAILVNINGTIAQAGVAYNVAGAIITFAEPPLVTDIIEVRYLSSTLIAAYWAGGPVAFDVNVTSTTTSISTTSGALQVAGGVGIQGNLYLGGNLRLPTTTGTPSNTSTPAAWQQIIVGSQKYYLPLYQ